MQGHRHIAGVIWADAAGAGSGDDTSSCPAPVRAGPARARLLDNWPLLAALGLLWLSIGLILLASVSRNHGHLVYCLDDAYIHMALAKHLVQDQVWGVTKYAFSSSQSSLLWPLLLALTCLPAGPNELAPLALNIILASLLVACMFGLLRRCDVPPALNLLVLVELIIFTPLPLLVFEGMEHILQALLALIFVYLALRVLAGGPPAAPNRDAQALLALAPLLVAVRYEGLLLVAVVAPVLLWRRGWRLGLALPALALVPLLAYAVASTAHGGYWLPNSALMKSNWFGIGLKWAVVRGLYSPVFFLAAPCALLYAYQLLKRRGFWTTEHLALLVFLMAFALQVVFASTVYPRYVAYVLTLGLFAASISAVSALKATRLSARWQARTALAAMALLFVTPLGLREAQKLPQIPIYTSNIYQQQYQMGLFLRRYYQGAPVAANDIGAINYLADIRLLDLAGLGTTEVTRAWLEGHFGPEVVKELATKQKIRIALVYATWFPHALPGDWILVGAWQIPDNFVCGENTVSFFATNRSEARRLSRAMREFSSQLPPPVKRALFPIPSGRGG